MNTSLQTTEPTPSDVSLPVDISWPDLQAAISGNLARLTAEGQVKYYNALCKFTGLNPLGFPFAWIQFQGKLTLYAKKECADQLRGIHKINGKIIERSFASGVHIVRAILKMPDGREIESSGVVPFDDKMPADAKCKAMKVAETQAYRRGTFALVGLSMMGEEEMEHQVRTPPAGPTITGETVSDRVAMLSEVVGEPVKAGATFSEQPGRVEIKPIEAEIVPDKPAATPPAQPARTASGSLPHDTTKPATPPVEAATATGLTDDELLKLDAAMNTVDENKFPEYTPLKALAWFRHKAVLGKDQKVNLIKKTAFDWVVKDPERFHKAVTDWVKGGGK